MGFTPVQLLNDMGRIASELPADPVLALRRQLRLLVQALALDAAQLLLLSPSGKSFNRRLQVPSPGRLEAAAVHVVGSSAGRAMLSKGPVRVGRRWWFPVGPRRRAIGILCLVLPPRTTISEDVLTAVVACCAPLASVAAGLRARPRPFVPRSITQLEALSAENDRKFREISLLYRLSKAMHSTLRLNELMHLILSAATVPEGGGFEVAILFMANERSRTLQGMLGVTGETAPLVLPATRGIREWEQPVVTAVSREAQRQSPFCRNVVGLRFSLDDPDNALARAARGGRVIQVPEPRNTRESAEIFPAGLGLSTYACVPFLGRDRLLAVLVVGNAAGADGPIAPGRLRFLELFASLAAAAMENSMLLHRLETAHQNLRETQERLIQGEKMAVLGEMAASVAHELKNPLVAIGGFARRLSHLPPGDDRCLEYGGIVVREVERMEKMLDNILAFSKKHMLCFAECRIAEVVAEALAVEADALEQAEIITVTDIAADLPVILGDGQKLRQVFINLVANARQAMGISGGQLTVRIYPDNLRGETAVVVEIEDTGGGIPAAVLRNIFNPFFTTKEDGTGLGLPITHRIVEHHSGEIEVQNRELGAAFIIHLPVGAGNPAFR